MYDNNTLSIIIFKLYNLYVYNSRKDITVSKNHQNGCQEVTKQYNPSARSKVS